MSAAVELLPATVPPLSRPRLTSSHDRAGGRTGPEVTARGLWQLLLPPADPDRDDTSHGPAAGTAPRTLSPDGVPGAAVLPGARSALGRGHRGPGGLTAAESAGTATAAGHVVGLLSRAGAPPAGARPVKTPSRTRPDLTDALTGTSLTTSAKPSPTTSTGTALKPGRSLSQATSKTVRSWSGRPRSAA